MLGLAPHSEVAVGAAALPLPQCPLPDPRGGDLVLRWVLSREGVHKLSPMWEGPFRVARVSRPGAVHLETQDGVPI